MKKNRYYSNCLFEAVRAKIRDPKNVTIIRMPGGMTGDDCHFAWINKCTGAVSHFTHASKNSKNFLLRALRKIVYYGKVKTVRKEVFDRFSSYNLKKYYKSKLDSKLKLVGADKYYHRASDWLVPGIDGLPSYENGLPFTSRVPCVVVLYRDENERLESKIVYLEPGKKPDIPDSISMYKYPTILDGNYSWVWGKGVDYFDVTADFLH